MHWSKPSGREPPQTGSFIIVTAGCNVYQFAIQSESRSQASKPRSAAWATRTTALAETVNGLFKTEVIWRRGPWKNLEMVEHAVLEWVHWFNNRRILGPLGFVSPREFEAKYYEQQQSPAMVVGLN